MNVLSPDINMLPVMNDTTQDPLEKTPLQLLSKPLGPYSPAVRSGNLLYLSGQIGINPETMMLEEGMSAQAHRAFQNMVAVIKAYGGTATNIRLIKVTLYLTDMEFFSLINEIMAQYIEEPYPARSTIGIQALPQRALVEIEAIAELTP